MFEAIFRITAQVKSDGQGQRVFRVTEREAPANDAEFLSRLATMYQQEVCTSLQPGDNLTVAVRLDLPPRELERTVHLREDRLFEGEGYAKGNCGPTSFHAGVLRAIDAVGGTRRCLHDHIPGAATLAMSCVALLTVEVKGGGSPWAVETRVKPAGSFHTLTQIPVEARGPCSIL